MKKQKGKMKGNNGILRTLTALVITAGLSFLVASSLEAANIQKERGRVIVDLDNFALEEATSTDCGLQKDGNDGDYILHYRNDFTDRNNLGATFRSKSTYEGTDVIAMEAWMYAKSDHKDKAFIYMDSTTNKKYHRWDNSDLDADVFAGRGSCWTAVDLSSSMGGSKVPDSDTYLPRNMTISPTYGKKYVFIGISHDWYLHRAYIYMDNHSRDEKNNRGYLSLELKQHKISMLPATDTQRLKEDGSGENYKIATNLQMGLDDGHVYNCNEKGTIYRDERIVLKYTLTDRASGRLKSLKFYRDKDKKTFLYEKMIDSSENQTTITFDAGLIQNLEKSIGTGALGDVYFEPVFERVPATVEWMTSVPEFEGMELIPNSSNKKEMIVKDTKVNQTMGTITMNGAYDSYRMGDMLTLKYKENPSYTGSRRFQYYEMRICESQNQVSVTPPQITPCSGSNQYDVSLRLEDKYIWIQGHGRLAADVTLQDKTVTYNGRAVEIEEAEITWPEGEAKPTGSVTYRYYEKKENGVLSEELSKLPVDAGTYYVTATLAQDSYYGETVSDPATLMIEKAVPTLSNLRGTQITYGQPLNQSKASGTATGVSGSNLAGDFTWVKNEDSYLPNAGTRREEMLFTPTGQYATNYATATGTGVLTVNLAKPKITVGNATAVYDGTGVEMTGATVTGVDGKDTGQQVIYEYYRDSDCKNKMDNLPVDAGTYYVLGKVYAEGNYDYTKTTADEAGTLTITPREAGLIQIPLSQLTDNQGMEDEYRVYVTNLVKGEEPPIKGIIKLSIEIQESTPTGLVFYDIPVEDEMPLQMDNEGRYYAKIAYSTILDLIEPINKNAFTVNARFVPDANYEGNKNYNVKGNEIGLSKNSQSYMKDLIFTYGDQGQKRDIGEDFLGGADKYDGKITWVYPDSEGNMQTWSMDNPEKEKVYTWSNDIASFDYRYDDEYGREWSLTITPKNAGSTYCIGYVSADMGWDYYTAYLVTVNQAEQIVEVTGSEAEYDGQPHTATVKKTIPTDPGNPTGTKSTVDAPEAIVRYKLLNPDGTVQDRPDQDDFCPELIAPTDVGTYLLDVTVPGSDNYKDYHLTADPENQDTPKIVIIPATPTVTLKDKVVSYNRKEQAIDKAVVTGVLTGDHDGIGDITYRYWDESTDGKLYDSARPPIHAGDYKVTATVAAKGNYEESTSVPVQLTIQQVDCDIDLGAEKVTYDGTPKSISPSKLSITGVDGEIVGHDGVQYGYVNSLTRVKTDQPTEAGLYYAYVVKSAHGNYKPGISDRSYFLIQRASVTVGLENFTAVYDGESVETEVLNKVKVVSQHNVDLTQSLMQKGDLSLEFYEDAEGTEKLTEAPKDAGTYYVRAFSKMQDNYKAGVSNICKVTIEKAVPVLSNLTTTDITYGQPSSMTLVKGTATGVKGENLNGSFSLYEEQDIYKNRQDAGNYEDVRCIFTPCADVAHNYKQGEGTTSLTVVPFEPKIDGRDMDTVYNAEFVTLEEVMVTGAMGMPGPKNEPVYTYYKNTKAKAASLGHEGVKDAGTYTCVVTIPAEKNYKEASTSYEIRIEKAPSVILLQPQEINRSSNTVKLKGYFIGAYDNPTGEVLIYQKKHGEERYDKSNPAALCEVKSMGKNLWGFETSIHVGDENGTYDFLTEYRHGEKDNYEVLEGDATVYMNRDPQKMTFEQLILRKEYGDDEFQLILEEEGEGTGKITFSVLEAIGKKGVIEVTEKVVGGKKIATVKILDVGTTFAKAIKAGDSQYHPAAAICCIRVDKAPLEILLKEDVSVEYTGEALSYTGATLMSKGKKVPSTEKVDVTYIYLQNGRRVEAPLDPGEYRVLAIARESEHYLRAVASTKMTVYEPIPENPEDGKHPSEGDQTNPPKQNDTTSGTKTGDDTPVTTLFVLMLAAGCVFCKLLVERKRMAQIVMNQNITDTDKTEGYVTREKNEEGGR